MLTRTREHLKIFFNSRLVRNSVMRLENIFHNLLLFEPTTIICTNMRLENLLIKYLFNKFNKEHALEGISERRKKTTNKREV